MSGSPPPRRALPEQPAAPAGQVSPANRRHPVRHAIGVGLSAGFLACMALLATLVIVLPLVVGGSALTVLTGSMEPKLPPGTLVVIRPVEVAEIGVGDVITFQLRSGEPEVATHRVVKRIVTDDGSVSFVTKGDANDAADPTPVLPVQVRGRVWYAIPYLGWVNTLLGGSTRAIAVPLIAGLLFAYAAWLLIAGLRERRAARASRE